MSDTVHVNVGGTWKTATDYYVNVGGTWKTGSAIGPHVSGFWKGFGPSIYSTNLKLNLDASDSSSYGGTGTTWTDLTSEDNDATINGATYTWASKFGGVFELDGTDDYITVDDDASLEPTNSDWTFEAWINVDSSASNYNCLFSKNAGAIIIHWKDNQIKLWANDTASTSGFNITELSTGSNTLPVNGWHHIVISRASDVWKIYIDKVEKASQTQSFTVADAATNAYIGSFMNENHYFEGMMAQVRIYKGVGLTSTQVAANYDATKDITDLKLHLDAGDSDSYSGSGTTWTDLSSSGDSVDFDGSDDVLSIADSSDFEIDGANFTLECWFKADDVSGGQAIVGQWQSGGGTQRNFDFYLDGSTLYFENCRGSSNFSISTTVSAGEWYHIAGVLNGTTLQLFKNGSSVGTTTVSGSANNSTANFGIGGYATGTTTAFNGKISNVRFVKGTAVYTADFTPTTQPLTNISGTKLLCCQSNSSVTTATVSPGTITAISSPTVSSAHPFGNNGTIVGATFDSTNKWFEFDGTDDQITFTNDSSIQPSNVDWTWEGWVYVDSSQSGQYEFFYANDASCQVSWHNGNQIQCWFNDVNSTSNHNVTLYSGSETAATDTWHYVVISRISNVWKLYLNATEKASVTDTFTVATPSLIPTMGSYSSGTYDLNGRIAQMRIYKGTGLTSNQITSNYHATKATFGL